eukprot:scaffold1954_cov268-Pinguiococcus_pyrenoidosus.AAC.207
MATLPDIVEDTRQQAMLICDSVHGVLPEVGYPACTGASAFLEPSSKFLPQMQVELMQPASKTAPAGESWFPARFVYHGLLEVMKNALSATIGREVLKNVITVTVSESPKSVAITVQDRALGMEPDHLDSIQRWSRDRRNMKRYDRLDEQQSYDSPQRPPLAGLGYGLPIATSMLEYLHGRLLLSSAPGHGTTVTIILPKGDQHQEKIP